MTISELKKKYSESGIKILDGGKATNLQKKYYPAGGGPEDDLVYGFLCMIYDGINTIEQIKNNMHYIYSSSMKRSIFEDEDVQLILEIIKRKNFVTSNLDETLELTQKGKEFVEDTYYILNYASSWVRRFLSEKFLLMTSAICLLILSFLKIFIGLNLMSQGMITEGIENLTDLIKIGIISLGLKYGKDRLAGIIIIFMMMTTGISMIYVGIDSLLNLEPIYPSAEGFLLSLISIITNYGLLFYKGMVGRATGNLSLLSDAKDSEINAIISAGVFMGLFFAIFKYYFIDSIIGLVIAVLIFKEGIEFLREIFVDEADFDITTLKVKSDVIFKDHITRYLIANIKRGPISEQDLLKKFDRGIELGRLYYRGFADFFYSELGSNIAERHLHKLLEAEFVEIKDNKLKLTQSGIKYYKKIHKRSYKPFLKYHKEDVKPRKKIVTILISIFVITVIILIIYYTPIIIQQINLWIRGPFPFTFKFPF